MPKILGAGWIKNGRYKLKRKRVSKSYIDLKSLYLKLKESTVFKYPVDNFVRFDYASKLTSIAVALALYDAGITYAKGEKQEIGILAVNKNGALDAQVNYFKDYLNGGRILGRGNLFIYTLPSSPLAEAAIHFGLTGPLLYMNSKDDILIEYAGDLVKSGQAKVMLALSSRGRETAFFVIGA